jgi:formylglycine-generating enzyme required for sulfatase activity
MPPTSAPLNINEDFFFTGPGTYGCGLTEESINLITQNSSEARGDYLRNSFPRLNYTFDRPFYLSKKLITRGRFSEFAAETSYITDAEKEGWGWILENGWLRRSDLSWRNPFGTELDLICRDSGDLLPVMQASWNDAAAFCAWYSEKYGVRAVLPSEPQWEAARETADDGCVTGPGQRVYDNKEYLRRLPGDSGGNLCHPFGTVWEWTSAWFKPYPGGPFNREYGEVYRVLRGGSLFSSDWQKLPAYRFRRCPTARSPYYGFRIAIL